MASPSPRPEKQDAAIDVRSARSGERDKSAESGAKSGKGSPRRPDGWRETIESVVVAFILAFLFRTFEAEAFVIPTGSMAPTLYGQHRDVHCTQCGSRFAVGVSSGTAPDAEIREDRRGTYIVSGDRTHFAVCPNANCRFPNNVIDREIFAGDRILVNKFPYEFSEPERWDVVVFKFPEGAKTNYIKRLVGLPGEEVKLEGGDVKVRALDSHESFRIARKAPDKQKDLQLLVYDNDRPARVLLEAGWPEAWAPEDPSTKWSADAEKRSFRVDPDETDPERLDWIRYTHYVPSPDDWARALEGRPIAGRPQPEFIADFYAYNSRITVRDAERDGVPGDLPGLPVRDPGSEWVGDLTVNCCVEVLSARGEIVLELVESRRRYRCTIDLETGRGALSYFVEMIPGELEPTPAVGDPFDTGMNRPGMYAISFANVDDRLCVWVEGRLVKSIDFDEESRYEPQAPVPLSRVEADRAPVAIGARGAELRVSHLLVQRDIFYRDEGAGGNDRSGTYRLENAADDDYDQFLMLGDNSPRSNDSRLWQTSHAVPRRLLIGKAFFIYWPHAVPFLNDGRGFAISQYYERDGGPPLPRFSIPFYPQFGRMERIR